MEENQIKPSGLFISFRADELVRRDILTLFGETRRTLDCYFDISEQKPRCKHPYYRNGFRTDAAAPMRDLKRFDRVCVRFLLFRS